MSTVTEVSPPTPAPTQPSPMARFHALPAWLRYMVYAAIEKPAATRTPTD